MTNDAKPDTWMPLVIGDYLKGTKRLTTEQHGAYLLIIMDYWVEGPPPDDDSALASITGLDARRWRRNRPVLVKYFRVEDGVWRHKRIDEELADWSDRKRRYVERAAAGGRAKAAKSTASSSRQAPETDAKSLLKSCSPSISTEVDGPTGRSTLCGQNDFIGPKEVRDAFVTAKGEAWTASYIDPCAWQDVPERALVPATATAGRKIISEARKVLSALGLTVLEKAA